MEDDPVEAHRKLYEATGNPLYAWSALRWVDRTQPLPSWIFDYLSACAGIANALHYRVGGLDPRQLPKRDDGAPIYPAPPANGEDPIAHLRHRGLLDLAAEARQSTTPVPVTKHVPAALGLSRHGFNAFKDWRALAKAFGAAIAEDDAKSERKKLSEIRSTLDQTVDAETIRKRARHARKLLKVQVGS